ncbi:MAG: AAA family ATPase [Gemmataceae bacterium]|nr:AAA family ATPase [Gemmataceae bacterium]
MRFLRLDLKAFGPFDDSVLEFEPGVGGLHFIYGPNEAGKSSLLRALQALLFGVPVQTSDAFLHSMKKLRLGATLRHSNGAILSFWRRKARINTLFDEMDEDPIPEDSLDRFLGGIDRDVFAAMFGLDQESLVRGGQDILQGKGQLGPMLFAAGSGISDARAVQDALRDEWESLFKATGRTQIIPKRIGELTQARKETQERELSLDAWSRHDEAHREAVRQRQELQRSLDERRGQHQRLSRLRDALPLLSRHGELVAEERADQAGVVLPPDFGERRRTIETNLRLAKQRRGDAAKRRVELEQQIAEAPAESDWLSRQDALEALHRRLADVQRQRRQHEAATKELRDLERLLAADRNETNDARWTAEDSKLLRDLGQRYGKLAADAEHRQRRLGELEREIAKLVKPTLDPATPEQLAALHRELSELDKPQPLPTEAELQEARRRRDDAIRSQHAVDAIAKLVAAADCLVDRMRFAGKQAEHRANLQHCARELQRTIDQTAEVERRQAALRDEMHRAREASHAAQQALLDWRARWQPLMPRLGLDPQAEPTEAFAAVDAMQQRGERRRRIAALKETLANIDRELEGFAADVRSLCGENPAASEAAVQEAYACLKQARIAAERLASWRKQLDDAKSLEAQSARDVESAERLLEALRAEANAESLEELPRIEERSAQRRQRQMELARLERQLDRLRDGVSLDDWRAEAMATDPAELDRRIGELASALEGASGQLQELDRAIGRTQGELSRMDGAGAAAESAQNAENLASQLCSETEQFLVLRLAHGLLQEAVDAWRQKCEDGIVRRAIDLFKHLTCGSFEALDLEVDDKGQPIVYGMRAGTRSKVPVDAMSDGSRDQLYLALRLASLESWLQTHEPIPLIVDDLLLNFDDDRALAAMQALCEASKRTQVLFFTHHRHLIELAGKHLPTKRVFFHELGQSGERKVVELF